MMVCLEDKKIFESIDNHDYVSFNLFDTLLVGSFCKTTDLFSYIEKEMDIDNFKKIRLAAEKKVRKVSNYEEVTIQEIYSQMGHYKDYIKTELDVEEKNYHINPKIVNYYEYARRSNKKIIVISDTCLPEELIQKILKQNGINRVDYYYISSSKRKQKKTGSLFIELINDLNIEPCNIIHVGCSYEDDVRPALKNNIKSVFISKIVDDCVFKYRYNRKIVENNYELSQMIMQIAIKNAIGHNDYLYKFGYEYGGPLSYSFVKWIIDYIDHNKDVTDVLFIARDGFLLKKMVDLIRPDIKTHYVYAPRIFNLINNIDYKSNHYDTEEQLKTILKRYGKEIDCSNSEDLSVKEMIKLLQDNHSKLECLSRKERENYRTYLGKQNIGDGTVAIVDTITDKFSAQKVIEGAIDNRCIGLYWVVLLDAVLDNKDINYAAFQKTHAHILYNWNLTEMILSSPEPPIIGLSEGAPEYGSINEYEKKRIDYFNKIAAGVMDYFNDVMAQSLQVNISNKSITSYLNNRLKHPSEEDMDNFESFIFSSSVDHSDYCLINPFRDKWTKSQNNTFIFGYENLCNELKKHQSIYRTMKKIKNWLQ